MENIMARATKTKDGFTVTTIEQAGAYEGQAIGRVLLLRGDNCDYDHWTLGSVESADEAANQAPNLTRKEFTEYLDALRNYREIMHWWAQDLLGRECFPVRQGIPPPNSLRAITQ